MLYHGKAMIRIFAPVLFLLPGTMLAACASLVGIEELSPSCQSDDDCTGTLTCDIDGSLSGMPGMCIAVVSPPDASVGGDCSNTACPREMPVCEMSEAAVVCVACTPGIAGDRLCATGHPDTPVCSSAGACVECVSNSECNAASATPLCNTESNTCRGCELDSECASGICLSSGACEAPANIVYVRSDGEDDGNCTIDEPCQTVSYALDHATGIRQTIRILSTDIIVDHITINDKDITIVGDGARISADFAKLNVPVLTIQNNSIVNLRGLAIGNALGSTGHGIFCDGNLRPATLNATNVAITDNAAFGIDASECQLSIDRSSIIDNDAGGIDIRDGAFIIINSVISFNGDDLTSAVGGLRITNTEPVEPQILAFNTIARNRALSGATGVNCTTNTAANITSNIVQLGQGPAPSLAGNCAFQYSNIRDKDTLGAIAEDGTNVDEAPTFVNLGARDFHLPANDTTCKERGQPITDLVTAIPALASDIDGDDRPQGSLPDIGADEIL